jgi:hypothetical protein
LHERINAACEMFRRFRFGHVFPSNGELAKSNGWKSSLLALTAQAV